MTVTVCWFRRDLRLADNPALSAALQGGNVVPLYIHDPQSGGDWPEGSASRWWLHHSLRELDRSLQELGSRLVIRHGRTLACLRALMIETGASRVCWNRRYEPAHIAEDSVIKRELRADGHTVNTFNSTLLYEPWQVLREKGKPYKVFTPFWKAMQAKGISLPIQMAPIALPPVDAGISSEPLDSLGLKPRIPWDAGLRRHWRPGEGSAQQRLETFISSALANYDTHRDWPGMDGVSRLSSHLHFGEIGPRQIVRAIHAESPNESAAQCYIRELAWREFANHLLFHFPNTPSQPFDQRFATFPWCAAKPEELSVWQRGETGIPIVDAGMRELWETGWMHNRVRMLVASLLTKNLLVHWLVGACWFWDTLVDADLANNTLGWQWTAGCGADAAPYFRIFNPVVQGERFDPNGTYIRRWVPEIAKLPAKYLHCPWTAPANVLETAGLELGVAYPLPIVELKRTRDEALARFKEWRERIGKEPGDSCGKPA
jgi:deoxyribodipyrimidine photo-lyase